MTPLPECGPSPDLLDLVCHWILALLMGLQSCTVCDFQGSSSHAAAIKTKQTTKRRPL